MLMLNKLLGSRVVDKDGETVGKLIDFVITREPTPDIKDVVILTDRKIRKIEWCVKSIDKDIKLKVKKRNLKFNIINSSDLLLRRTFLNEVVILLNTKKVVRLSNIGLSNKNNKLVVIGGFYRRGFLVRKEEYVEWEKVLPLIENIRLRESLELERIPNADLAEIISSLGRKELKILLKMLNGKKAAEVISRLDNKNLKRCVKVMNEKTLLDFLNLLKASRAASILKQLSGKRRNKLLSEMEIKKVGEVNEILKYSKSEVGSLMDLKPISFNKSKTVGQIIKELREQNPDERNPYYLYVTDDDKRIVGVLTLRRLLVSNEKRKAGDIMLKDVIRLETRDSIGKARRIMKKYRFSALPVVNSKQELKGIITMKRILGR